MLENKQSSNGYIVTYMDEQLERKDEYLDQIDAYFHILNNIAVSLSSHFQDTP